LWFHFWLLPLFAFTPSPVATTWALSFETIEKASPAATEFLRFCAFLDPAALVIEVPRKKFKKGTSLNAERLTCPEYRGELG